MKTQRQLLMLAASIFLGVLWPELASLFKPLLFPTVFLLFFFAVFQVRFADAVSTATRNWACTLVLCWQLVVLPVVASVVLMPFLTGHWYLFSIVTLCTSSITATTAFAKIFNLNDAMALSVCVLGTVLMPIPLYVVVNLIAGLDVPIEISVYVSRIVLFIFIPFVLVWLIRKFAPESITGVIVGHTPSIVLLLLMVFGLSVMDGVRAMIENEPVHLLLLILLAFSISLLVQISTYFVLLCLGKKNAITACLLCAYRNMGVVAAIAGASLGEYFLIFVGVWQLPMYILPLLLQRFYRQDDTLGSTI